MPINESYNEQAIVEAIATALDTLYRGIGNSERYCPSSLVSNPSTAHTDH